MDIFYLFFLSVITIGFSTSKSEKQKGKPPYIANSQSAGLLFWL